MKTVYVYDPVLKKCVLKQNFIHAHSAAAIHTMESFKSPIDGTIIRDAAQLRSHNRKHGVTDMRDYGSNYFDKKHQERTLASQGQTKADKQHRIQSLIRAVDKHQQR